MNFHYVIVFVLALIIFNYLIYLRNKAKYFKAGKKWDGIVKELSKKK